MKHRYSDFTWKEDKLFLGEKDTGYKIFSSGPKNKFFKIEWPDGNISNDFYNKTRVKENAIKVYLQDAGQKPLEAH